MEEAWELAAVSKKLSVKFGDKELVYENDAELLKKLGNILNDIISPFSEGFGALGDKIRFYRAKSTLEILGDAKFKADNIGISLEDVSPRFMINWAEAASAEDTNSEESLKSLWANLLVNAAGNDKSQEIRFISILSQMTSRHAQLLNKIHDEALLLRQEKDSQSTAANAQVCIDSTVDVLGDYMVSEGIDKDSQLDDAQFVSFMEETDKVSEVNRKYGVDVVSLVISGALTPFRQAVMEEDDDFQASLDLALLGQFGLIESFYRTSVSSHGYSYNGKFSQFTHLGLAFADAVSEPIK